MQISERDFLLGLNEKRANRAIEIPFTKSPGFTAVNLYGPCQETQGKWAGEAELKAV